MMKLNEEDVAVIRRNEPGEEDSDETKRGRGERYV